MVKEEFIPIGTGKREKVYSMDAIKEDFEGFLDKFSKAFLSSKIKVKGYKFEPLKTKVKDVNESEADKKVYYELKARGQKMFLHIKLYFLKNPSDNSKMDVWFKAKMKGKGFMTKKIAKMIISSGQFHPEKFGKIVIDALNKAI